MQARIGENAARIAQRAVEESVDLVVFQPAAVAPLAQYLLMESAEHVDRNVAVHTHHGTRHDIADHHRCGDVEILHKIVPRAFRRDGGTAGEIVFVGELHHRVVVAVEAHLRHAVECIERGDRYRHPREPVGPVVFVGILKSECFLVYLIFILMLHIGSWSNLISFLLS